MTKSVLHCAVFLFSLITKAKPKLEKLSKKLRTCCMLCWTVCRCEWSSPGIGRASVWDACTEQGCYTVRHIRPWSTANQVCIPC